MKKIITFILSFTSVFCFSLTSFAQEIDSYAIQDNSKGNNLAVYNSVKGSNGTKLTRDYNLYDYVVIIGNSGDSLVYVFYSDEIGTVETSYAGSYNLATMKGMQVDCYKKSTDGDNYWNYYSRQQDFEFVKVDSSKPFISSNNLHSVSYTSFNLKAEGVVFFSPQITVTTPEGNPWAVALEKFQGELGITMMVIVATGVFCLISVIGFLLLPKILYKFL